MTTITHSTETYPSVASTVHFVVATDTIEMKPDLTYIAAGSATKYSTDVPEPGAGALFALGWIVLTACVALGRACDRRAARLRC